MASTSLATLRKPRAIDATNRIRDLVTDLRSWLADEKPDDEVLAERARAQLGGVSSHPAAIQITVRERRATLRSPALAGWRTPPSSFGTDMITGSGGLEDPAPLVPQR